jgi:hypothetical protein
MMSIRSLAVFNGSSWPTRRTRDEDFYLATGEDLDLATYGDFLMAMDTRDGQSAWLA